MPEGLDKQIILLSRWSERSSATNWNGSVPEGLDKQIILLSRWSEKREARSEKREARRNGFSRE
ncbi:hypothetical protein AOG26_16815 [Pseudoalteromonas sp. UCD-33C]|nr:hypothetical protein AOG26_16815 [Pseudoalteromonas sp. UCD-33C]